MFNTRKQNICRHSQRENIQRKLSENDSGKTSGKPMSWFLKPRVRQFLECSLADNFCKRSFERGAGLFLLKIGYCEIWDDCNRALGVFWGGGGRRRRGCCPNVSCRVLPAVHGHLRLRRRTRPPPRVPPPSTSTTNCSTSGTEIWTRAPKIVKIHYKCNKKIQIIKTNTPPTEEKNEVEQTPPSPTSSQLSDRPAWICILQ